MSLVIRVAGEAASAGDPDHEMAGDIEYSMNFGQQRFGSGNVLEHVIKDQSIEGAVTER